MAITPVILSKSTEWQIDYRAALLEYSDGHVGITLDRAITGCIKAMRDNCVLIEHREVAIALDDLFLLRHLHYKHEAVRMAENGNGTQ